MRRLMLVCAVSVLAAAALAGCSPNLNDTVSGEVVVPKATAYPVGSVLVVRVSDVTASPVKVVGSADTVISPGWEAPSTHPPIEFEVRYPASAVDDTHTYVVTAEITHKGSTLASSGSDTKVITNGAPSEGIELPVN